MAGGGAGGAPLASNAGWPKLPAVPEDDEPDDGAGVPVLMNGPVARDGLCGRGSIEDCLLPEWFDDRWADRMQGVSACHRYLPAQ